jgi:Uma2 family endonuclease
MRIRTPGDSLYTYPDVIVACNPEFLDDEFDTVTNPVVIFEVLSPSTADFDSRPEFNRYRQIPTLRDYILVSQERMSVEHRSRSLQTGEDHWWVRVLERPEEELVLDFISCRIKLEQLYERISFDV